MVGTEYRKVVLSALRAALGAAGFKAKGSTLSRPSRDVVHLVDLQGSQSSTSTTFKCTVNLGVLVLALHREDYGLSRAPATWLAHWRERLGFVCPERRDLWWTASSMVEAHGVADDVATRAKAFAVPALDALPDKASLLNLLQSGRNPGLTAHQAARLTERLCRTAAGA